MKQAIRTGLAGLLAIIIYRYKTDWTQAYWIILAAAFLMQTRLGLTQQQQVHTLLLSGICAALLAFLASFFWNSTLLLAVYLAVTTFIVVYLSVLGENVAIASFFINLFAIMSAGLIADNTSSVERFWMILIGTFIALLMCLLWPTQPIKNLSTSLNIYFLCLAEFSGKLSEGYLCDDYLINKSNYEKQFHERRNRSLRFLNKTRDVFNLVKNKQLFSLQEQQKYELYLENVEHLYELIISLGNIRHRLTDNLNSSVIKSEVNHVHHEISHQLREVAQQKIPLQLQNLSTAIHQLEVKQLDNVDLKTALMVFIHTANNIKKVLGHLSSLDEDHNQ